MMQSVKGMPAFGSPSYFYFSYEAGLEASSYFEIFPDLFTEPDGLGFNWLGVALSPPLRY